MRLSGKHVTLRPPTEDDARTLARILGEASVARWWPGYDLERVRREMVDGDEEEPYVIEHEGRVVGYIQAVEENEPDFRHASIDLFMATDAQGQGLGPDAIRAVAVDLIDRRGHHRLTIDPAADNTAAIAAYTKVGFRPVGRLRRYQRIAPGVWVDGLLMEMLADELVR